MIRKLFAILNLLIKFFLNFKNICACDYEKCFIVCIINTLDNIRKSLSDKINDSYLFTLENLDKIQISDESDLTAEDILVDNKKNLYYFKRWKI